MGILEIEYLMLKVSNFTEEALWRMLKTVKKESCGFPKQQQKLVFREQKLKVYSTLKNHL